MARNRGLRIRNRGLRLALPTLLLWVLVWLNASTLRERLMRAEATTIAAGGVATGIVLDFGLHRAMVTSGIDSGDQSYTDTWTHQVLRTLRLGHTVHAGNSVFDGRHGHVFMAVTPNCSGG